MKSSKGFSLIQIILVLAVIGMLVGAFFFFGPKNSLKQTSKSDDNNTCTFGSETLQKIKAPMQSAEGAFTSPLTDLNFIDKITPGSKTGDSRLTYLWIKKGQKAPVFAPADGTLVRIAYKVRTDFGPDNSIPDYDLTFMVDCKTIYQINHITELDQEIAKLKPNEKPYEIKPGSPAPEEGMKPKDNITVKAGQQLGTTTGTPNAHTFDFGIFVSLNAVCPYNKFAEPMRSQWLSLFKEGACEVNGTY